MIGVDKIDDIRKLGRNGASIASIARSTGVSEPTVRTYLREPDLSERPPAVGRAPESPLLEPFAGLVDSWLLEDRRCWFKQRHTARRVLIFTKNWSSWSRLSEHRGHEKLSSLIKWAAPRGQGRGPRHTVSRAATLASPPGKDGGDDRAPGRKE